MGRFKIYGLSSTLIVTVFGVGIILYIVFSDILVLLAYSFVVLLLFLLMSAMLPRFYRGISQTTGLKDNALNARKAEIAGMMCNDCITAREMLKTASELVDVESAESELDRLGHELASMKCCSINFEVEPEELGSVDLTFLTTRSTEVRDRLSAIKRSVASRYLEQTRKRNLKREESIKKLLSAGYGIGELYKRFEGISARNTDSSLDDLIAEEQEAESITKQISGTCIEEARRISSTEKDRVGLSAISEKLLKAGKGNQEFNSLAEELSGIRKRLQHMMGQDFISLRDGLINSMDAVSEASRCAAFSNFNDELEKRVEAVRNLTDAGRLGELREAEKEYRQFIKSSLGEISKQALSMKKELLGYKPPRDLVPRIPSKIEAPNGSLPDFTKKLTALFSELSPNVNDLYRNVRIMRSYPKVERLIDHRLKEKGKLLSRDIDIRYPEVLFMLYKKKHAGVKYVDSPEPKLISER